MKKKLLSLLLVAVLSSTVALYGCGSQEQKKSTDTGKAEKTLVLYSPNQPDLTEGMVNKFKQETGIDVQVITGGTGELLQRVQAEKDNPLGDVFWAGGAESLEAYKKLFQPYATTEKKNIGKDYCSTDNSWNGFAALPMVIMYNKKLVPADKVPTGWADLLKPEWKGKISFADPNKSGSSYTQMMTMYCAMGGWDFVGKFATQLKGVVESSSTNVPKKVSDGEMPLGITLEDNASRFMGTGNIGIVYPAEGTSTVPDGMAIIKGAKHPNAAKKFLDFLQGKEAQTLLATQFKRRPVREDAGAPAGLVALKDIKVTKYDFNLAANKKNDNLNQWKDLFIK